MVHEFLGERHVAVPQTFNMSALLNDLQPPVVTGPSIARMRERGEDTIGSIDGLSSSNSLFSSLTLWFRPCCSGMGE